MCIKLHSFKARLKELRKEEGYTQKTFAEAFGVSYDTVKNWEQCRSIPEMHDLLKLCDFFECDMDYLLGRINCRTHDMQFIHDYTGLSEDAIAALILRTKTSKEKNIITCDDLITNEAYFAYGLDELMDLMQDYCKANIFLHSEENMEWEEINQTLKERDVALFRICECVTELTKNICKNKYGYSYNLLDED